VEKFASDGSKLRLSSAEICPFETTGLDWCTSPEPAGYRHCLPRALHREQVGFSRPHRTLESVQLWQAFLRGGTCFLIFMVDSEFMMWTWLWRSLEPRQRNSEHPTRIRTYTLPHRMNALSMPSTLKTRATGKKIAMSWRAWTKMRWTIP
jgi:hypothetical protein